MNRLFALEQEVTRVRNRGQQQHQASMQLAIETAYVIKTDKGGAYLHTMETDAKGNITSVGKNTGKRVPTGERISVDTGKTHGGHGGHIWARYKKKTGAIKREHVAVLPAAFEPASVLRSDVIVTDTGVKVEQATKLWDTTTSYDKTGRDTFVETTEMKSLPIGANVFVQPLTRSGDLIWAMHVSRDDYKFGAVNVGHVLIERLAVAQVIPTKENMRKFFQACWTRPWLKALYRGYLKTEHAVENLDFLSAVAAIRNRTQAQKVLDHFVDESTGIPAQEVNISKPVKKSLIAEIKNPSQNYPDWRIPFGFNEQNGTTYSEHLTPRSACSEVHYFVTSSLPNSFNMRDHGKRSEYIKELEK